jgi:hypothetical protein
MRRRSLSFLLGATLLLISLAADTEAQRRRGTARRAPSQAQQQAEARRQFEEQVRDLPDQGSDLAFVFSPQASIHEEASLMSKALAKVNQGEALALMDRAPAGEFYRVIHVDTATEGWIDRKAVVVKYTTEERSGPPLEVEDMEASRSPELVVTNLEDGTDLNLRINGTLYVIRRNTSRTFTLKPGKYKYYGYSAGIRPARGEDNLVNGKKYSWTFRIMRR